MRKLMFWFPTWSHTNQAVQLKVDGWKLEILDLEKHRDSTINVAKIKALISFVVTAKLICVLFSHMKNVGFLMTWLI